MRKRLDLTTRLAAFLSRRGTRYVYLLRLKNTEILPGMVSEGVANLLWQRETFVYADGCDETRERALPGTIINDSDRAFSRVRQAE